jgi:hypothetical protein
MKGKLIKDHEGWWVQHKAKGLDGNLEYIAESILHPDDVKQIEEDAKMFDNIEARIAAYPDVEFEMVTEVVASVGDLDTQDYYTISYAKLILSKEQQKELITEIMNEDAKDGLYEHSVSPTYTGEYPFPPKDRYDTVNDTVNKMAEEMYGKGKVPDYEEGFIDGYKKAQETLYTEEQVREAMSMARKLSGVAYTNDEIIQSLKQPKKD